MRICSECGRRPLERVLYEKHERFKIGRNVIEKNNKVDKNQNGIDYL